MVRPGAKTAAAILLAAAVAEYMRRCCEEEITARDVYFWAGVMRDLMLIFVPDAVEMAAEDWAAWVADKFSKRPPGDGTDGGSGSGATP